MQASFARIVVAAGVLLATIPAAAHHSAAVAYNLDKTVTVKGVISEIRWVNPHTWIHIDVAGPDGKVERWTVEGGAPNALIRRGWTKNSLPYGIEIIVEGFQAKDGANRANGLDITFPDGRKLSVGSSGTGAPDESRDGR